MPIGKTPYEILYNKKPNLKNLPVWGCQVWVHNGDQTKLDGQSTVGRWMGYNDTSNGHCIYWPEKHSVMAEQSVKFLNMNDFVEPDIIAPVVAMPIQGENTIKNQKMNPQWDHKQNLDITINPESQSQGKNEHTISQAQPIVPFPNP